MLKAMLIDDEQIAIDVMEILLEQAGGVTVSGKFLNVLEALEYVQDQGPDIIFLDIEMPGLSGLSAAAAIAERCPTAQIIFVTAHQEYAIDAFETGAFGYLLKPVSAVRLSQTLERFKKKFGSESLYPDHAEESGSEGGGARLDEAGGASLVLKVMGSMELYGPLGQLITWRTRKTKELFAYLWHAGGEPVYRLRLMDDLWPEVPVERAQTLLHTTIYNLRRILKQIGFEDCVRFGDERYWLLTDDRIGSDYAELMAIFNRVQFITLEQGEKILSLYRGDYLDTEYYGWAIARRQKMRDEAAHCLRGLAERADEPLRGLFLRKLEELEQVQE
ncbi:response regulator [Paenibacillus sp. PAMC21692]|uniref:response regulator n=1 Tax=Paenibacillus sp. PAMC21692 TaxID=2762320 RepID=UPI00164E6ABD|nr:response regulator [Paenibacillus sp. PAMC21692]QNK56216.1 response regulator [Paenibacillus sp. PAMC21692]